jgi:hypothetical protein
MPGLSARPVETGLGAHAIALAGGRCRLQADGTWLLEPFPKACVPAAKAWPSGRGARVVECSAYMFPDTWLMKLEIRSVQTGAHHMRVC